jgi:hypothetical protein
MVLWFIAMYDSMISAGFQNRRMRTGNKR